MSVVHPQPNEPSSSLKISEDVDHVTKDRFFSGSCVCFHKRYLTCSFRVWQFLLLLFAILVIMGGVAVLTAIFGPGKASLGSYRGGEEPTLKEQTERPITAPTEPPGTTKEKDVATKKKPTEPPTPPKATEPQPNLKPTTPQETTVKTEPSPTTTETKASLKVSPTTAAPTSEATTQTTTRPKRTQDTTTAQPTTTAPPTTAQPTNTEKPSNSAPTTTAQPSSTEKPTTTALTTTAAPTASAAKPTTAAAITDPQRNISECGTAIVGAGAGGLLVAYSLFDKTNETNVCVFDTEDSVENIYDHVFPQVPDVIVGLGQWDISGDNYAEQDLLRHLFNHNDVLWNPKTKRVEARGQYANSFDDLKLKAFPTLRDHAPLNNKTLTETAAFVHNNQRNFTQFSTAETFLFYELSPEGTKLMAEKFGFKGDYMQAINPMSYRTYLEKEYHVNYASVDAKRPPNSKGLSEIVTELTKKVERGGGKIYRKETVASINKEGDKFLLQTTKSTVTANKTVITVGPAALKKIEGDVIRNITGQQIFESIVGVPAFYGAAVYDKPWWNDTIATQNSNNLQPLEKFISSSDCLGITMPYKGNGTCGRVVLHTIANNGGCSDKWGKLLEISQFNDVIDKELKRALKYKFQRDIPDPLETTYKYWKEGFWFFQKPGANFSSTTIRQWARRPLTGQDVFLVNRAYYNFGGYLEYTIRSAFEAVKEGWNSELPFDV